VTGRTLRIAVNGATGRMGYRQHLVRSLLAIRDDGGLRIDDRCVNVEPVLVGRSAPKLKDIADRHGIACWTTDLDAVLGDPAIDVYFDSQVTSAREAAVVAAIKAGKAVYVEKPVAGSASGAWQLARAAATAGVVNGVVHDKLFLPGLLKLRRLIDGGFFGRVLSVRGEFGYWVFEGDWQSSQRPSWNYRSEDGGGIVIDMFCHWNYLLENLFGSVRAVTARTATHIPQRWGENGSPYRATADDAAYGIFELAGGVIAQINSSWCTRVRRDELVEFQVDGTEGSAVAGLRQCVAQHRSATPKPVWNPDEPTAERFRDQWVDVPDNDTPINGFRKQWEDFLGHVLRSEPYPFDLAAGARGLALAEAGLLSSAEGRRVVLDTEELTP
jgi:predicted dehydrogenase